VRSSAQKAGGPSPLDAVLCRGLYLLVVFVFAFVDSNKS
jgi:hypothetical protein